MYCKNCGNKIEDGSTYCPNCGSKQDGPTEKMVWTIFAKVGYILGIVSLPSCLLFGLTGTIIGIYGIVFSILGKKSIINLDKAKKGLILSIIGAVLGFTIYIWLLLF